MQMIEVPALEYIALKKVDEMVRVAMTNANSANFLVEAIQALDAVRRDLGIDASQKLPNIERPTSPLVSELAQGLIARAMEKKE